MWTSWEIYFLFMQIINVVNFNKIVYVLKFCCIYVWKWEWICALFLFSVYTKAVSVNVFLFFFYTSFWISDYINIKINAVFFFYIYFIFAFIIFKSNQESGFFSVVFFFTSSFIKLWDVVVIILIGWKLIWILLFFCKKYLITRRFVKWFGVRL